MHVDPAASVQKSYKTETDTRSYFGADADLAADAYEHLLRFVTHVVPPGPSSHPLILLDVGCGSGWSTALLAKAGYNATGTDLNAAAFEPPPTPGLTLVEGSALELPFPGSTFDVVTSYQCLEHIPDPQAALREMLRVLRPGGTIVIAGPNLLSLTFPIRFIVRFRKELIWHRTPSTPRHPYGNTVPEMVASAFTVPIRLLWNVLSPKPRFPMRTPDTVPPFSSDNDACYLCNPVDLIRFFSANGLTVVYKGRHDRSPHTALFAGGTWVAARKPATT